MHDHGGVVNRGSQHGGYFFVPGDFGNDGGFRRFQNEPVGWVFVKLDPAIATHGLHDVNKQGVGNGEARVAFQDVDKLFCIVTGGAGVPHGKRGDAVGVNMLRGAFQFREGREGGAGFVGKGMIDF